MKKLFGILLVVALVLSFSLVATTPVAATTHNVGPGESIQDAIDGAAAGDTIIVAAGTYAEFLTVDRSLTLIGPNAGSPGYGPRDDEAVILPPAGAPFVDPYDLFPDVIWVTAENVVIDGFTFRPRNPDANGENDYQATNAIYCDEDGLELRNNIIEGFPDMGVWVRRSRGSVSSLGPITGVVVENNYIKESYHGFGFGFYLQGTIGHVLNNTVAEVLGNQVQPYGAVADPGEGLVSGNTISARGISLYHNYDEKGGEWTYSENVLTPDSSATWWEGIRIQTVYNDPTLIFTDNTIDGQGAVADDFRGLRFLGDVSSAACDNLDFSDNDFEGLYVFVEDGSTGKYVDLDAILADNTFVPPAGIDENRILAFPVHNVSRDTHHPTIQDAIDNAEDGNTIVVGPGTYYEDASDHPAVSHSAVVIDVPNLTLKSAEGRDLTIIDAGEALMGVWVLKDLGDVTVEGFTVRNWKYGGIVQSMGNSDGTATHVLDNFSTPLPVGPTGHGNSIQISGDGSTVIGNVVEVRAYPHLSADSPTGILNIGASDVIISDNYVYGVEGGHEEGGTYGIAVGGHEGHGWGIATDNTVQGNTVEGMRKAGIAAWASVVDASILNNVLSGNEVGFLNYARDGYEPTGTVLRFNSISDNIEWGVLNEANPTTVDATLNWWGDASGPTHASNPGGIGDKVSDNVLFDPWLGKGAEVETATGTGTASFIPSRGVVEDLEALPAVSPTPRGVSFPHGMFEFKITGLMPGETVMLTIELPEDVPVGTVWWKYQDGSWYSLPNVSDNGDNIMVVELTDGGLGDTPGSPEGEIHDPGGPGNPVPPLTVGWAGSSVDKAAVVAPWIALFAAMIAGATLVALRRRHAQV